MSVMLEARELFLNSKYFAEHYDLSKTTIDKQKGIIHVSKIQNIGICAAGIYSVPKNYKQYHVSDTKVAACDLIALIDLEADEMWVIPTGIFETHSKLNSSNNFSFNIMNEGLAQDYRPNYWTREEIKDFKQDLNPADSAHGASVDKVKKLHLEHLISALTDKSEGLAICQVLLHQVNKTLEEIQASDKTYRALVDTLENINERLLLEVNTELTLKKEQLSEIGFIEV